MNLTGLCRLTPLVFWFLFWRPPCCVSVFVCFFSSLFVVFLFALQPCWFGIPGLLCSPRCFSFPGLHYSGWSWVWNFLRTLASLDSPSKVISSWFCCSLVVGCFLVLSVGCASSAGGFLSDVGSGVFFWRSLFRKLFWFLAIVGVFFGLGAAFSVKVWRSCLRQWLSLSRCLLTWKIFFFHTAVQLREFYLYLTWFLLGFLLVFYSVHAYIVISQCHGFWVSCFYSFA